jgi:glycosyltransferase involved in cell wall biosynthesis
MRPRGAEEPGISLCMIVRDEEAQLPRLLKSAAPYVQEIVVVDTGSKDATVEIAKGFGARVFHHPWQGSFAKHRNQSISYAGCGWILIMDADEELSAETAPFMAEVLTKLPDDVGCVYFELFNESPGGLSTMVPHPRLFKNDGFFHYEGRVHNRPVFKGKTAKSPIRMVHYGYNLDSATMEKKYQRRIKMIGQWLAEEPENYAAHTYLAQAYLERPSTRKRCAEHAAKALKLAQSENAGAEQLCTIYYPLMASLHFLGRYDEAAACCLECLRVAPHYPDPHYFLINIHFSRDEWPEVCGHARSYTELQARIKRQPAVLGHVENMTQVQAPLVLYQWFLAAWSLKWDDDISEVLSLILDDPDGEAQLKRALGAILAKGDQRGASLLARTVLRHRPQWGWLNEAVESRG